MTPNFSNPKFTKDLESKPKQKVSPWILIQVHEFDYIKAEPTNHICTFQIKRNNLRSVKKILNEAYKKENMF